MSGEVRQQAEDYSDIEALNAAGFFEEELEDEKEISCVLCSHSISGGECGITERDYFTPGDVVCSCCLRSCRVCGCTDVHGCPEGCWWVDLDLCSSCDAEIEVALLNLRRMGRSHVG